MMSCSSMTCSAVVAGSVRLVEAALGLLFVRAVAGDAVVVEEGARIGPVSEGHECQNDRDAAESHAC
jgi:hypothetical protein